MSESTAPLSERWLLGPIHLTRLIIAAAAIVNVIIFHYAAEWAHWPDEPGFHGSLLQPVAVGAFIGAIMLLIFCTALGSVLAGRRWFLAGLLTATAGLTAWPVRGGSMLNTLFQANENGLNEKVYLLFIVELVILFAVIAGLWNLTWLAAHNGSASESSHSKRVAPLAVFLRSGPATVAGDTLHDEEGRSAGVALLAQTALFAVLILILGVTPLKKQMLTTVFVSGVVATAIAEYFFADRKAGRWYWAAPLVVGIAGYVAGYLAPAGLETGDLQGMFAPLTRVLPLHYASMGCAGVLFGYWWMEPDVQTVAVDEPADPTPQTATEVTEQAVEPA